MRVGMYMALCGILVLGATAGCEALWGGLSVPAGENCVVSGSPCQVGQVCNPVTQLCQDELVVSAITPARAPTSAATPLTISGAHFVPGMRVKWNGSELLPVTVDSPTTLRVTAPMSPDGGWLVTVEVTSPSSVSVRRSDLFSYYATSVSLQAVTTPLTSYQGLSAIHAAPLLTPTSSSGGVILGDGTGHLRALTFSSDGKTATDLWNLIGPANLGALLLRDLNGDGVRDLLIAANQGFYWLAGNPDRSFRSSQPLRTGVQAGTSLAVGDVDGNGQADLVGIDVQSKQIVLLTDAGTRFSSAVVGTLTPDRVAVAELDGKPGDEIAVAYRGSSDHFSVISGGSGAVVDVPTAACTDGWLQAGRFTAGTQADLLLSCTDRVQLLVNSGQGAFNAGSMFLLAQPSGQLVDSPAVADFDGDGDLDVVILQRPGSGATQAELYLLDNSDGRGALTTRLLAASVAVPASALLAAGDVNSDGKPDVVIGDRLAGAAVPLTVLLNLSR